MRHNIVFVPVHRTGTDSGITLQIDEGSKGCIINFAKHLATMRFVSVVTSGKGRHISFQKVQIFVRIAPSGHRRSYNLPGPSFCFDVPTITANRLDNLIGYGLTFLSFFNQFQ